MGYAARLARLFIDSVTSTKGGQTMARPSGYYISSNDWPVRYPGSDLTVPQIYSMLDKFDNYGESTGNQPPPSTSGPRSHNQGRST